MNKGDTERPIDEQIEQAGILSLEHSETAILTAVASFKTILTRPDLSADQRLNTQLGLASALQRRGEHHAAIDVLNSVGNLHELPEAVHSLILHLVASSYSALGFCKEACDFFSEALARLDKGTSNPQMRAAIALEAGKAFSTRGDSSRARELWQEALEYFEGKDDAIEHYARAKANLAFDLLHDADDAKQREGVRLLGEASNLKACIGDLEGLANSYCNLGLYYWRKKQYQRAIAYTRRDLYLSRKVGDLRAIATTLGNLSQLYAELKQLSPARELLREAERIGENLGDERLIQITKKQLELINVFGKEAGERKEIIGPTAACACGSSKEYQNCCGRADFEPIDIPIIFGGVSEDLDQIAKKVQSAGQEPSRLDFIMRQTPVSKRRLSWSRWHVHDGWVEMHELPDMANHHLLSAKALADEAKSEPDSPTKPLACAILSACALEAYINQVAFFLDEIRGFPEARLHFIPTELSSGALEFQRNTRLEDKWNVLGQALCRGNWPPPNNLWTDVQSLIYIRNELVHFKAADYEQVVPPPRAPHEVMRRVPAEVQTRQIPHGWPMRLLTPSFAEWCVSVTEKIIDYFKQSYSANRGF
jgi:tetratricopeptide (TPR) repeat protein